MLQDAPRNDAYRRALLRNGDFIQGKTVLDVGAGTGILSVFCAQAGAAKVYAVEASGLHKIAAEVAKENKLEHIIEVLHSRVEDLTLPNALKVDVIVSEWMGFYLFHEGMLDSVITARDKFLKEDGRMFPESVTLYAAPCSVPAMYQFWNSVSGVSMQCVGRRYRELKSLKPQIVTLAETSLLAAGHAIFWADLRDVTVDELHTVYHQNVLAANTSGLYQGLCLWFTCQFPATMDDEPVVLSTAPGQPCTHWQQTVLVLPAEVAVDAGSPIAYELRLQRAEQHDARRYNIEFTMLDPEEITHPEPCDCHMTKCILIRKMIERYESGELNKN